MKAPRSEAPARPPGRDDLTVIANAVRIEGTLSGGGEILVNGNVEGSIEGTGLIHVANRGQVRATIHSRTVMIAGTVRGDITADERIELEATARVEGDITAPRILIRDGATFKGQVNMRPPASRPQAGDPTVKAGAPPREDQSGSS
jgi:cytoskeletal protein CcmA (bactofilin family)